MVTRVTRRRRPRSRAEWLASVAGVARVVVAALVVGSALAARPIVAQTGVPAGDSARAARTSRGGAPVRVEVGVRPRRVRVGDTFVLTVQVRGAALPEVVDLVGGDDVEMVEYGDRTSTALGRTGAEVVLERDFVLRAGAPGSFSALQVRVVASGDTTLAAVPTVEAVGAPLAWPSPGSAARSRRDDRPVRDEGQPPSGQGRDADRERAPAGTSVYPYPGSGQPTPYAGYPNPYPYSGESPNPYASPYPGATPYGCAGANPDGTYPGAAYPGGVYPGGTYPGAPYPGATYPGVPYPGSAYPGAPYPLAPDSATSHPFTSVLRDSVSLARWREACRNPWGATNPYAPTGWGVAPLGRGWAPTAASDPWWPELVPVLDRYPTLAEDPSGLVRLEAGLTPEQVYAGQQVTLVAAATFAPEAVARLGNSPELFPPTAADAWSVDIPYAPPTPAAAHGRVEEAHTYMRAFFPVSAGTLTVEPVRLDFSAAPGGGGQGGAGEISTEPLSVEVRPIPVRDAPPGWAGAVGRYRLRAWIEPGSVGWGESALLTVEVAGAGNVRALTRPDPGEVWGAELRATGERAVVEVRDGVVGGVKTFSWLVVPVEAGRLRIGPVILAYFDPWLGAFGQVASEEIELEARPYPGSADAASRSTDMAARSADAAARSTDMAARSTDATARSTDATVGSGDAGRPSGVALPTSGAPGEERAEERRAPRSAVGSAEGSAPGPVTGSALASTAGSAPAFATGPAAAAASATGRLPSAREVDVAALVDTLALDPDDAASWLALGRAFERARPGEGWAEWAFANGLRRSPRDVALRKALWGSAAWEPGRDRGLPRLPLGAGESVALAASLGALGLGLAFGALRAPADTRARRSAHLAVAGVVALAALGALEPWSAARHARHGIVVEGPTDLRAQPVEAEPSVARVASGTPLKLEERYGDWVRVESADGSAGWIEGAKVATLTTEH